MRDGQRVALNAAVMFAKQAIMAVVGVVFIGYLARRVGVADWGEFQASLAISSVVTVVAGIGVRGYLAREIAIRPELGARNLGSALAIRGLTGTLLLGATVVVAIVSRQGLGLTLLTLAAISQLATLLYSTMWLSFEAHERFQYILYVELGARVFVVGLASAFLALGFGIVAAATAFMVGNVLELGFTYYFLRTRLYRPRLEVGRQELWRIAKASIPIGLCGAIITALQQSDRVMLRLLAGERAVGIYSAAWVLSDNFTVVSDVLLASSFAAGMRLYARDQEAFGRLFQNCMVVMVVFGLPAAAGVFVLAPEIIGVVYGTGYGPSALVLRILACQLPLTFAFQVGTLPLLASKRESAIAKLLFAALGANVLLNLVLVPLYGPAGSAAATLLAGVGALVGSFVLNARWMRLISYRRLALVVVSTAAMMVAAHVARAWAGMWVAVAVGVVVYVALVLTTRAVRVDDLVALVRRSPPPSPPPPEPEPDKKAESRPRGRLPGDGRMIGR